MGVQPWKRSVGKRYKKAGYKIAMSARKRAKRDSESNALSYLPRVRRPDFGFPDKTVTRVRYCDVYDLTGAQNVVVSQVMRMNGLQDPDQTGVGHQPMWYDQWCGPTGSAPYSSYRVRGAKITVKFAGVNPASLSAFNQFPCLVGINSDTNSGLFASSASALMETSNCTWKILQEKPGGNNVITVTATYSPTRDLGVDMGDDTISALYNANPSRQFYAQIFKVDQAGNSTVKAYVEIEYLAEFFERNEVTQS